MKVLILIMFASLVSGCDGLVDPSSFPLQQPDFEYEVDTWGYNSEVYEITPKANSNYTCMMWMLDSGKAMGLDCFPKNQ